MTTNRRFTTTELVEVLRDFIDHTPFRGPTERAVRAHEALTELAERLEAAEREREKVRAMYEIASTVVDQEHAAAEAAESLNAELVRLLRESYGWMSGVEPQPTDPFLAEIRSVLGDL